MGEGHIPEAVMAAAEAFNNRGGEVPGRDATEVVEPIVSEPSNEGLISKETRESLQDEALRSLDSLTKDITDQIGEIRKSFVMHSEVIRDAYVYANIESNAADGQLTHTNALELYRQYRDTFSTEALAAADPLKAIEWDPEEFKQQFAGKLEAYYGKQHATAWDATMEGDELMTEITNYIQSQLATPLSDYVETTPPDLLRKAEEFNEAVIQASKIAAVNLGDQDPSGHLFDQSSIRILSVGTAHLYDEVSARVPQLKTKVKGSADILLSSAKQRSDSLVESLAQSYRNAEINKT